MRFPAASGTRILVSAALAGTLLAGTALASGTAAATAASAPASKPPSRSVSQPASGIVTGLVLGAGRSPLADACVVASGPAGTESAITSKAGRYVLPGLHAGRYTIRYRSCSAAPGWQPNGITRQVVLTGQQVTELAPATLGQARPGTARTATPSLPAAPHRISTAALHRRFAQIPTGGISGRVTDSAGHPLKNICVNVITAFGSGGTDTSAKGTFNTTTHFLPPGKYAVEFTPTCIPGEKASGNWAPQWYKNKYSQASANKVTIRAGKIARGIDAVMRPGGQITGLVSGVKGTRLSGVCVVLLTANGRVEIGQTKTRKGGYRFAALDPGQYREEFFPSCGKESARYLGQYWPTGTNQRDSKLIGVRLGTLTPNIDAALTLGGAITGMVRFKNRHGRPLAGICVYGQGLGAVGTFEPDAATGRNGSYVMDGLPTGRYSLSFGTGCRNHGNYRYQNLRHPVSVTAGKVTSSVNVYLQPGGILTGTVTAAGTGTPLPGICVSVNDDTGDGGVTSTTGSFRIDQLPPGRYAVTFSGGCGNSGSYAPQWFPDRTKSYSAALVTIKAGKETSGIDAVMRPGVTVTGTVANASGSALKGICVMAVDAGTAGFIGATGMFLEDTQTYRSGNYRIPNLAPGQYQVAFFTCGFDTGPGYVTQWFRSQQSEAGTDTLDVPAAAKVDGIDAVMIRGGAISGMIRAPGYKGPFLDVCVTATNRATHVSMQTETGSNIGKVPYTVSGLAAGRYSVEFSDCAGTGYGSQWYSGKSSPASANPVTVKTGRTTHSINVELRRGSGSIAGRVTVTKTGKPAGGVCLGAVSPTGYGFAETNASGDYVIRHLPPGRYRLYSSGCAGHNSYANQTRPGSVQVGVAAAVTGVNVAVSHGGSISGTVVGGPSAAPEPGVCVLAVPESAGAEEGFAETVRGGRYDIADLLPGRYLVQFSDVLCSDDTEGLAPQWYSGQFSQPTATPVTVHAGAVTTGIGGTLTADGSISGTVTGPSPASTPLTGICVEAVPVNPGAGTLDAVSPVITVTRSGTYTLAGVIPGRYRVEFSSGCGATGYADQWWDGAPSQASATTITVSPGTTTTTINAAMVG
jgi:hypothetical protein